jgi:hypothetical protein
MVVPLAKQELHEALWKKSVALVVDTGLAIESEGAFPGEGQALRGEDMTVQLTPFGVRIYMVRTYYFLRSPTSMKELVVYGADHETRCL